MREMYNTPGGGQEGEVGVNAGEEDVQHKLTLYLFYSGAGEEKGVA